MLNPVEAKARIARELDNYSLHALMMTQTPAHQIIVQLPSTQVPDGLDLPDLLTHIQGVSHVAWAAPPLHNRVLIVTLAANSSASWERQDLRPRPRTGRVDPMYSTHRRSP
ncbi:hypothetical protein [Kineosporia sp. NBRC 101731]|uniref:hypothetical protein n=1 Tax=Kineosporia sp. NBRC 101731 TaxID=3032199 RepID=UPI0024A24AF1|nr:hypothetical protein [Kineosporia sp. NBRC 101731]GLY33444.1 hypothetical protein Kisp02_68090 [Kineosporia sp. NBRC 101731]